MRRQTFNAGSARHKFEILKPVKIKDDFNSDVVEYEHFGTFRGEVTAVKSLRVSDRLAIQQRYEDAQYVIRSQSLRSFRPFEHEYVLRWHQQTSRIDLDILSAYDPAGTGNMTEIIARDYVAR